MKRFIQSSILCLGLTAAATLSSCTMMTDKRDDCPTGLYVRFVYDYNIQRADMFKDHCGHVKLYVYNEKGDKVAERSVSNTEADAPLRTYGYAIHFLDGELPDGRYRLQAVGMQKDWDEALAIPGAKHRRTDVSSHTDLVVSLDHGQAMEPGTNRYHVSHEAPLDTLWHTLRVTADAPADGLDRLRIHDTRTPFSVYPLEDQMVEVKHGYMTFATVSLIRDTKHLNITLRDIDSPDQVDDKDYEVIILDDNSHLGHDNEVLRQDSLCYHPYAAWTTETKQGGFIIPDTRAEGDYPESVIQKSAHYNVMFNRLMFNSDNDKSAILLLKRKSDGKVIARVNLPYILAEGRRAYDTHVYTPQEYLDREYDYQLDFLLKNGRWQYVDLVINVLSWAKRFQAVEI